MSNQPLKYVVLLSGGLDSTVNLYVAHRGHCRNSSSDPLDVSRFLSSDSYEMAIEKVQSYLEIEDGRARELSREAQSAGASR